MKTIVAFSGKKTVDGIEPTEESLNERFFDAWDATSGEQRVKPINIMENVQKNAAYQAQVAANPDEQNRRIALESQVVDHRNGPSSATVSTGGHAWLG